MTDFRPTNEQIAELILSQTYEERVDLGQYLGECARSWMESGGEQRALAIERRATSPAVAAAEAKRARKRDKLNRIAEKA